MILSNLKSVKSECVQCHESDVEYYKRNTRKEKEDLYAQGKIQCSSCLEEKSIDDFHSHKGLLFNKRGSCKSCALTKRKQYYHSNSAKLKNAVKQYRENNPQKIAESKKLHRAKHLVEIRLKERYKEAFRRKVRMHTPIDERMNQYRWELICTYWNNACAYCNKTEKLTIDHVLPVSKGGNDSTKNIVPSCQKCNFSKSVKTLMEWKNMVPTLSKHEKGFEFVSGFKQEKSLIVIEGTPTNVKSNEQR